MRDCLRALHVGDGFVAAVKAGAIDLSPLLRAAWRVARAKGQSRCG